MITIRTNINVVAASIIEKLKRISDPSTLLRPVAIDVMNMMTERIHEKGIAADGNPIGTYSPAYMKVRTGNYKNSTRYKGGKNAGKTKDAGVFSRGTNKGKPRPKYNRTNDTKIVVSLTRQLENDWAVIGTTKGYGIGFNNPLSIQKMRWVEEKKDKKIAALTTDEKTYAIDSFKKLVHEKLMNK